MQYRPDAAGQFTLETVSGATQPDVRNTQTLCFAMYVSTQRLL
jgi:hypothetical protein